MNKTKLNKMAYEISWQNVQHNKKRLIFLVYKEYLQISMVKITIHGESLDNHMNDLQN